jgi:hypothetical protein
VSFFSLTAFYAQMLVADKDGDERLRANGSGHKIKEPGSRYPVSDLLNQYSIPL